MKASDAQQPAKVGFTPKVGLAPMEGVGDLPLRLWMSQTSAPAFAMTPFLRVTRDYPLRRVPATYAPETSLLREEVNYELVPQLMGATLPDLVRIAEGLLVHASFVDFNCGCPSPTVVGNGAGSSLLESPVRFDAFVGGLAGALGRERMSIKMRTGFHHGDEFDSLLEVIVRHRPLRLTVHGRTRAQRYLGSADWTRIAQAASVLQSASIAERALGPGVEVVGSGDIVDAGSFAERLAVHGHGPVIVGRGALRNPFLFEELRSGEAVSVARETLLLSLDVHVLLQHLYDANPHALLDAVGEGGFFRGHAGVSVDAWARLREHVALAAGFDPVAPKCWEIARGAFFKMKMLWNSMRSGLPDVFFGPEPLRAGDYSAFRAQVESMALASPPTLRFAHSPARDWIYAGANKEAATKQTPTEEEQT